MPIRTGTTDAEGRPREAARTASGGEVLSVALLLAVVFAINIATASLYPVVWQDEVMFTDPAADLASGAGFHTTAWSLHVRTSFFAGYPPLYSAVLGLWIKLTGLSPTGVRSLNHVLITLVALLAWIGVLRTKLVASGRHRVLLVALVALGYGMGRRYRTGRPDQLMALLVAGLFVLFTVRAPRWRYAGLAIVSSFLPLVGMQSLPYASMMLVLLLVFLGRQYVKELLSIALGLGAGAVALVGLYVLNGAYDTFVATLRSEVAGSLMNALLGQGKFHHQNTVPKDLSLLVLAMAGIALLWKELRTEHRALRAPLIFAMTALVVIPIGMIAVGKFPTYYAWMVYLPLAVGVTSSLSSSLPGGAAARAAAALVVAACFAGLPFQLAYSAYDREDRDHGQVVLAVSPLVRPDDWVYCDYGAYYAARNRTQFVFTPNSQLSSDEHQKVTVIIVDPANAHSVQAALGGRWQKLGPEILPTRRMLIEDLAGIAVNFGIFDKKYRLQTYRRDGTGKGRQGGARPTSSAS